MSEVFVLPDGTITSSGRTYGKAWADFYEPIERVLGVRVYGFDPSLSMADLNSGGTAQIPMWLARRIRSAITGEAT